MNRGRKAQPGAQLDHQFRPRTELPSKKLRRTVSRPPHNSSRLSKSQFPVPPPPSLPCCLPGPRCQTMSPQDCVNSGGVVLPPDRPCSTDPCPGAGGSSGGSCGQSGSGSPAFSNASGASGGSNALSHAARIWKRARERVVPALPGAGGGGGVASPCRIDPSTGNLTVQVDAPYNGPFETRPIFTYNSQSTDTTEYGRGWTGTYRRRLTNVVSPSADLVEGSDAVWHYTGWNMMTGYFTPPSGARNTLFGPTPIPTYYSEKQPDGLEFRYSTVGVLQWIKTISGAIWTL